MSLPASVHERRTVELSGGPITVHGLTMAQSRACRDTGDEAEADALAIGWGADVTVEDARAWCKEASSADVRLVLDAILELSGLRTGAKFPPG